MRNTTTILLTSFFILLASSKTFAINNTLPMKTIAETAEQVSPLMNGQHVPAAVQVTTG